MADSGIGALSVASLLQLGRLGATEKTQEAFFAEASFGDFAVDPQIVADSGKGAKNATDFPFCLGAIPHANSKDFSFSFSTLVNDIITKKESPFHQNLSTVQFLQHSRWKEDEELVCLLPLFRDPASQQQLPIRMGITKSIKDIFLAREPPKRLAHHCAGGDLTLPMQHGFVLVGDVAGGNSLLVMSLSCTENPMLAVYDPFVPTKVAGMKMTSGKVRIGGCQMRMIFLEDFLAATEKRSDFDEGLVGWRLRTVEVSETTPPATAPAAPLPVVESGPSIDIAEEPMEVALPSAMDELLAAVTERESDDEDAAMESEYEESEETEQLVSVTEQQTSGTHSPLASEPTFVNPNASRLSYKRPSPMGGYEVASEAKVNKLSSAQMLHSSDECIFDLELGNLSDLNRLKSIYLTADAFIDSKAPISGWRFPSQSLLRFGGVTSVHISKAGLTQVPVELRRLSYLKFLVLSDNMISQVPEDPNDGLGTFPHSLQLLDLSGNQLERFPPVSLPDLLYLNLKSNRLVTISETFLEMPHLIYLNLYGNGLKEIPSSIATCHKLVSLLLSNNQLSKLPNNLLQRLSLLRRFEVARNQIASLESFRSLHSLRVFDGSFNPLKRLPSHLEDLEFLNILRFGNCQISDIKEPLPRNLQSISLNRNPMNKIPEPIYNLKRLQRLDVAHIPLGDLPDRISQITHLQSLNVCDTGLTRLPLNINKLRFLVELDIGSNRFSQFPTEIISLTGLRTLDAAHNSFTELPPEIAKLESLLHLDVSYNQLEQLPSFQCIRQLSQLDVSNNKLTSLHESIFNLAQLRFLYSSKNNLSKSDLRRKIKKRFCIK